ncbi:MAG: NAD(P)/FAD-dependent oxidoreductase [Oscillospiraceae bacterium]
MRDILIIGSGPAGLSAAIYAKRANLDVIIAEKEYMGTGQIAESSRVDNYIGLVGKSGFELGELFRADAENAGAEFLEAEITGLFRRENYWVAAVSGGGEIEARAVIYAAGASHRRLNVPGEERFIGSGVSFCALCDGSFYRGKNVAVIGGGDTAVDDALYLADIAEKVYLIHRRSAFRAAEGSVRRAQSKPNIEMILSANVNEISGGSHVEKILLDNGQVIEVDGVFTAIGMTPQTAVLKGIADTDEQGYVVADETGVTSAPGLFAAGDVRTKKLRQVITAASDGANAAVSAAEYLRMQP